MEKIIELLEAGGAFSVPVLIALYFAKGWFESKVLEPIVEIKSDLKDIRKEVEHAAGVAQQAAGTAASSSFSVLRSSQEAQAAWTDTIQKSQKMFIDATQYATSAKITSDQVADTVKNLKREAEELSTRQTQLRATLLGRVQVVEDKINPLLDVLAKIRNKPKS